MTSTPPVIGFEPLDDALQHVENHLEALGDALRERDPDALDLSAVRLHAALARAIDLFAAASGHGRVPEPLRRRLAQASAQVAAHRESLARATAALDRAIDILLPQDRTPAAYGSTGRRERLSLGSIAV